MALVGGRSRTVRVQLLPGGSAPSAVWSRIYGPGAGSSDPYRRGLPEDEPGWAPRGCHPRKWALAGSVVTAARTGGLRRQVGAGRALPGLPLARLLPALAPPHCASVGEPETRATNFSPARRRVSAAGAMACLAGLKTPWVGKISSSRSPSAVLLPP